MTYTQRRTLGAVLGVISIMSIANFHFEWGWFRGYDGIVAVVVCLAAMRFILDYYPTEEEIREHRANRAKHRE